MNVWVLSDIHSNLPALDQALALVDADPAPIVFLGDLFTYGTDPRGVLDRLMERHATIDRWVLGNHDEMYLSLIEGRPVPGYHRVPDWLRATVDWTCEQVQDRAACFRQLPFVRECEIDGIYLAHANPFGDWRYVDRDETCREAAQVLARRGASVGVFGHTHRGRFFVDPPRRGCLDPARLTWGPRAPGAGPEVRIINAGSVGQPRNRTGTSTILRLRGTGRAGEATLHALQYDVAAYVAQLHALPLPEATRSRLSSFFDYFATAGSP